MRRLLPEGSVDSSVSAKDLIEIAADEGVITRKEADKLHSLRMCRNKFQHPESGEAKVDKATLESWRDTVFSLKEDK